MSDSQQQEVEANNAEYEVGVEDENMNISVTNLTDAIFKTVSQCMKKLSVNSLKKAYPTFYKNHPEKLERIQKELTEQMESHVQSEVKVLFTQMDVVDKLTQLDEMRKKFHYSGKTWRPSGDVERDLRPHLVNVKMEHVAKLKEMLKSEERKKREIGAEIKEKNRELEKLSTLIGEKMKSYQHVFQSEKESEVGVIINPFNN